MVRILSGSTVVSEDGLLGDIYSVAGCEISYMAYSLSENFSSNHPQANYFVCEVAPV